MDELNNKLKALKIVNADQFINKNYYIQRNGFQNLKAILSYIIHIKNKLKILCDDVKPDGWKKIPFDNILSTINGIDEILQKLNFTKTPEHIEFAKINVDNNDIANTRLIFKDLNNISNCLVDFIKNHKLILKEYNDNKSKNKCIQCPDIIERYCKLCNKSFCKICSDSFHSTTSLADHKIMSIVDVPSNVNEFAKVFGKLLNQINEYPNKNELDNFDIDKFKDDFIKGKLSNNDIPKLNICLNINCRQVNKPIAKFCSKCSKSLIEIPHIRDEPMKASKIDSPSKSCAKCNKENLSTARFCCSCGHNLDIKNKKCTKCDKENLLYAKFCVNCGFQTNLDYKVIMETEKEIKNLKTENKNKLTNFINRLNNGTASQKNLLKKVKQEKKDLSEDEIFKIFAKESFRNLIEKIKLLLTNMDKKDRPLVIPKLSRLFVSNLNSLALLIGNNYNFKKITTFKCEIFLNVFLENLKDLELDLEDTLHTIEKNEPNPDAFIGLMTSDCGICFERKNRNKIITFNCIHKDGKVICIECFKRSIETELNNAVPNWSCGICGEPNANDKEKYINHLSHLTLLVDTHLSKEISSNFSKIIVESSLKNEKNFVWCQHGCNTGCLVTNPEYYKKNLKVKCENCKKHTCFVCREPWEPKHEGKNCNELEAEKVTNGVDLIECPNCNEKFVLARGGCLHYVCQKCKFQFCGSCKCQMSNQKMESCKTHVCNNAGFHGHHPYNCFSYIRDFEVDEILQFLNDNGKNMNLNVSNEDKCQQMVTNEAGEDKLCQKDVFSFPDKNKYGYCMVHIKLKLYNRINEEKLDPISMYNSNQLKTIIERQKLIAPQVVDDTEIAKSKLYIDFINANIQKKDLSGFKF